MNSVTLKQGGCASSLDQNCYWRYSTISSFYFNIQLLLFIEQASPATSRPRPARRSKWIWLDLDLKLKTEICQIPDISMQVKTTQCCQYLEQKLSNVHPQNNYVGQRLNNFKVLILFNILSKELYSVLFLILIVFEYHFVYRQLFGWHLCVAQIYSSYLIIFFFHDISDRA